MFENMFEKALNKLNGPKWFMTDKKLPKIQFHLKNRLTIVTSKM